MKKNNPKVSIVIPVYNGSNYLAEAIDSVLSQTYKNIEIIVVNDGSNDDSATEKIAKSYGNKIRYYRKVNGGTASALNFGVKKMTGEYFSWLSHDDLYYPDKIKKQIEYLRKCKDRNIIVFTDYEYINEDRKLLERIIIKDRSHHLDGCHIFLKKLINGLTLLIPKKLLISELPFNIEKKYTQDYDMWYRLLKGGCEFRYLNHCGCSTRLHVSQDSRIDKSKDEADLFWLSIAKGYDDIFKKIFLDRVSFILEMYIALRYSNHENTKKYLMKELYKENLYNIIDKYNLNNKH